MATNPLFQVGQSPNNATQPTKAVNRQSVHVPRTHNNFDMSYWHFKTHKFGQYEPFFVMECVPGDTITFANSHNVRSLPFASPFLSKLTLNKDYFLVPNFAIQPNTYEYIFREPVQGDDIPFDAVNTFPLFIDDDLPILDHLFNRLNNPTNNTEFLYTLFTLELFCSNGSLLYQLGFKLNPIITYNNKTYSFDNFFDFILSKIEADFTINLDSGSHSFSYRFNSTDSRDIDSYTFASLIRSFGSDVSFTNLAIDPIDPISVRNLPTYKASTGIINMDRIIAYQMSCYQYYVNPQVDFIYNAQLYRDNLFTLYRILSGLDSSIPTIFTFDLNGVTVPYDYCSRCYYDQVLGRMYNGEVTNVLYDYLSVLFGHVESLRFGDYFTDSRTRALSPGDDKIEVVDGSVSVIDTSRHIVLQRFRNAVVKLTNNIDDYLSGIFGTNLTPDYHFPKFIIHQEFDISGFEVANTSQLNTGKLYTNLKSAEDTSAFEISIDIPCLVIGISHFSLPRVYCQTKDRHFFHADRFDYFNPMLQYTGDQVVYNEERTDLRPNDEVFGYQSRYNEYKQRFGVVSGGFVDVLPSYTFVTDSLFNPVTDLIISDFQSPAFIRAHDYEFNRFMFNRPGSSAGHGFHFIIAFNNKCNAIRPMEVNPNIL